MVNTFKEQQPNQQSKAQSKQQQLQQIAVRLALLPDEKKAAFRHALQEKGINPWKLPIVTVPANASGDDSQGAPLSFAQQRLWFVEQMASGEALYNLVFGLRFQGELHLGAIEKSVRDIATRHAILRTCYRENAQGEGRQYEQAMDNWCVSVTDLRSECAPVASGDAALEAWLSDQASQPFDLGRDWMFRFPLAKVGENEHVGLFVVHHIAFDYLSIELMVKEFATLYSQYATHPDTEMTLANGNNALPELSIQYADFARWQREWASSSDYQTQKQYWQQQLADAPATLALPSDFTVSPASSPQHKGARVGMNLPLRLSENLRQFAKSQGVTLYMPLLALFTLLLSRYCQQEDVCVGTSIANRSRKETEALLGFFVNLLVMRNQVNPSQSFTDFVAQVNQTASAAYDHQDIPFDHLVEVLGVKRDPSSSPLFQVLFVLTQGDTTMRHALPNLDVTAFHHEQGIARYALTLRVNDLGEGSPLFCQFEYNTARFAASTPEGMLQHLQFLCESALQSPAKPLKDLPLVDQAHALAQLQPSFSHNHAEAKTVRALQHTYQATGIHQIFEHYAANRAAQMQPALVCEQVTLTYAQLNAKANQLAHYLLAQGSIHSQPENPLCVALYMARSELLIIGLLACLKAGAAYVPLDTKWPAKRIQSILESANISWVLSESSWQTPLAEILTPTAHAEHAKAVQSLLLDEHQAKWHTLPEVNPEVSVKPKNTAYIIFTSGSTGTPKGVEVSHGNLMHYTLGVMARLHLDKASHPLRFGHISTIAADLGNTVLFGALCSGGCLHLITTERAFDPDSLAQYMDAQQVDVLKIVPSHLQGLLNALDAQEAHSLTDRSQADQSQTAIPASSQHVTCAQVLPKRLLILGGEACSLALIERILDIAPKLRIVNHYGPSETTIGVLTHEVSEPLALESARKTGQIPLGKPLANTQTYVLDDNGQLCPSAVSGELYIGGLGVAKGYVNQPAITKERFLADPFGASFGAEPGATWYRTGDRVKRLVNGDLLFLGRVDNQVKVRGYRVELGDIETCLVGLPLVKDARVVLAQGEVSASLVAFVVLSDTRAAVPADSSTDALSQALAKRLPEYMVPAYFVPVEALPLNANGKVDVRQLQERAQACVQAPILGDKIQQNQANKLEPTTENERILLQVIQQVLRRDEVQLSDNFFEAGGDSILSLQVIARAKRQGVKLTPKQFIQQSSIAQLAEVAETVAVAGAKGAQRLVSQEAESALAHKVPLLPIQRWFFDSAHPQPHYWNQSMLFQSKQALQVKALRQAVAALVQHHAQLRAAFNVQQDAAQMATQYPEQWITQWHDKAIDHYFIEAPVTASTGADFCHLVNHWQSQLSLAAKRDTSFGTTPVPVGQLFKVVYFKGEREKHEEVPDRLFIVAHHLIIDGVSWRIVLDDLMQAYQFALAHPQQSALNALPEKTAYFSDWAQALTQLAQDNAPWQALAREYWQNMHSALLPPVHFTRPLCVHPLKHTGFTLSQVQHNHFTLDAINTHGLLQQAPMAYKTRINDLLLSALSLAYAQQKPEQAVYLELEGHGREQVENSPLAEVDVSRTVGWFTSRFPVLLPASKEASSLAEVIKSTKEVLRRVPLQGLAYGVLKEFATLSALPTPALSFNYLGQMDADQHAPNAMNQWFLAVPDTELVRDRHPDNLVTHLVSMNAMISQGQLHVRWSHIPEALDELDGLDVARLGQDFMQALTRIIAHCGTQRLGYTPSDFPLLPIEQAELDAVIEAVVEANKAPDNVSDDASDDTSDKEAMNQSAKPFGASKSNDLADIEDIYPMTPMQEGLMFHTLLKPGSGIYVMQYCYSLRGHFDHHAFVEAGRCVVAQHPILRTSFLRRENGSLQIVHRRATSPVSVLDWRHKFADIPSQAMPQALDAALTPWLQQKLQQGFDLSRPTQLEITLIRTGEDSYQLVRSFHHILMDAWCFSLLMNDFMRAYQAIQTHSTPVLSQPRPYRDYIEWLQQVDMQRAETFWRENLTGFYAPTALGIRSEQKASGVKDHLTLLSEAQTARLHEVAKKLHSTVNTLVQGAWGLLLSRYSGDTDIIFGVTVAGRPTDMEGADGILGLFINSLPLALKVSPGASPKAYLQQVWEANHRIREYEFAPLVDIHRWSQFPAGAALFDSLFVFENAPLEYDADTQAPSFELAGITNRTHTNYPLTVVVYPKATLGLQITYDCAKFADADVARMLANFRETLLNLTEAVAIECQAQTDARATEPCVVDSPSCGIHSAGIHNPEQGAQRIGQISILPASEQRRLLVEWNQTYTHYPREQCWPALFAKQVEATPHALAVACEGESLTYRQLQRKAQHLAKTLVLAGVGANDVVAVLDNRGLDLMVMMVAVLNAGAAYLPLDPKHPTQRLANVLHSSQPKVVLTGEAFQTHVLDTLTYLEQEGQSLTTHLMSYVAPTELALSMMTIALTPDVRCKPSDLAYVIYTSGSTGLPKGAMVEHLGMLNNVYAKIPLLSLTSKDVIAQTASQCFDISVWQCLTGLLCGARVQVYPDAVAHHPHALLAAIEQDKVTVLESVPSLIQSFVEWHPALSALRWLMPTGEALSSELARQWLSCYPHIPMMNAYGPAECADDVAMWPIRSVQDAKSDPMPIGKPTDNNRLYVLTQDFSLQPVGVAGELYVSGAGVGRGYLNDAERTKAAFFDNPLLCHPLHDAESLTNWDQPERLYKTGDIARWREDGVLEYLGRCDHQVKIRGFRIELGDVESVLQQHAQVKDAVVMAKHNERGEPMLVAYVVQKASISSDRLIESLKQAIDDALPAYMQPAAYAVLDAFPLTPNGKIDRKALPDVDFKAQQKHYTAPQTPLQAQMCDIWQSVLKLEQVGIEDNFFELGGHSLLAVRLITHLEKAGVCVPLAALFQSPTIRELAASTGVDAMSVVHPLRVTTQSEAKAWQKQAQTTLFCVHHGGGHTRQYQALANSLPETLVVYGIQARSLIDPNYEAVSLQSMAHDYALQIREVQPEGPYRLLGWSIGGVLAMAIAKALEQQSQTVAFVGLIDANLADHRLQINGSLNADSQNDDGKSTDAAQDPHEKAHFLDALLGLIDTKKQALYQALPDHEKSEIESELMSLPTAQAVARAVAWAVEKAILPASVDQRYLALSGQTLLRYQALLLAHRVLPIKAKLHVCWAQETLKKRAELTDWAKFSGGVIQEKNYPGNHFDIVEDQTLFADLALWLAH